MSGDAMVRQSVSVVIPTLNAAAYIPALIDVLFSQSLAPEEVILVDSLSTDGTTALVADDARIRCVSVESFSHGGARNLGAETAKGDIVVFLTQDALPANPEWLRALVAPFDDDRVAAACSRQMPRDGASPMERFFLAKRFGDERLVRNREAISGALGFENVLFSNVSSAVRRTTLREHPFDATLLLGEDQQLSRDLIDSGYTVVYEPLSVVLHSHSHALWQTFQRYFDSVYSLAVIFGDQDLKKSARIGRRYVKEELRYMVRKHPFWLPYYLLHTTAKVLATLMAHHADRLPRWLLRRISFHAYHWG